MSATIHAPSQAPPARAQVGPAAAAGASPAPRPARLRDHAVMLVGAGGNIGSHLVPHLARMGLGRIVLCDPDTYGAENLTTQAIGPPAIGQPKAQVQREVVTQLDPEADAVAIGRLVQDVPRGQLRVGVLLACVDNRATRLYLNQTAFRLGVPWVDAAVEPDGLLVRVSVVKPGPSAGCLECAWSDRDYALLEQQHPCQHGSPHAARTNAPAPLGALAAALQAIECRKLLEAQAGEPAQSRQILLAASTHKLYVSHLLRRPECRFDHETWKVERLPAHQLSVAALLDRAARQTGSNSDISLRVEGRPFVRRLVCPACSHHERTLRLAAHVPGGWGPCGKCGTPLTAPGFDMSDRLAASELPPSLLAATVQQLGLHEGDVVSLSGPRGQVHYQIEA